MSDEAGGDDEAGADDVAAEKSPLRRTLDACLFAPVGVAMAVKEDLPGLIGKGRDRVEMEISNARVAGEYVVGRFQRRMSERLEGILHNGNGGGPGRRKERRQRGRSAGDAATVPTGARRPPTRPRSALRWPTTTR